MINLPLFEVNLGLGSTISFENFNTECSTVIECPQENIACKIEETCCEDFENLLSFDRKDSGENKDYERYQQIDHSYSIMRNVCKQALYRFLLFNGIKVIFRCN